MLQACAAQPRTMPRSQGARPKTADFADAGSPGLRARQSERRRQDILQASAEVLAEGYADFSLRKVAAAAGVRLNTVQHHFGDLESLIHATVMVGSAEQLARFRQLAAGQYDSPIDDLMVFLDEAWVAIRDPQVQRLYLEVWPMGLHRPNIAELLRQLYADYRNALAALVRRVNPGLTEAEANTLSTLIASWTEGALVMARWGGAGMPSLSLVGLRMKAACLALLGTPAEAPVRAARTA
jgi:AcrR family transcriptional regulator